MDYGLRYQASMHWNEILTVPCQRLWLVLAVLLRQVLATAAAVPVPVAVALVLAVAGRLVFL